MQKITKGNISYYTYSHFNPNEIQSFTTTRYGGVSKNNYQTLNMGLHTGDSIDDVLTNRNLLCEAIDIPLKQMVMAQQTHSATVYKVTKEDIGKGALTYSTSIPQTDALITNEHNICITIQTADCVPVLLYDTKQQAIAVIHAGWRGTMHNICSLTLEAMANAYKSEACDIKAIIGPSISAAWYEVGDELIQAAYQTFGEDAKQLISKHEEKQHFDLWQANSLQLIKKGLREENILITNLCTYSNEDFFSARKEGIQSGRIMSGLMLRK